MSRSPLPEHWHRLVDEWCRAWSVPGLAPELDIRLSSRLRVSLGRCTPQRRSIRLAEFLLEAPEPLVREVLCHETAHVAVVALHGRRVRPHGQEWRALMTQAGFAPRARLPGAELARLPASAQRARTLWEHRCPVCQSRWMAGRPVRRWRCRACREAGLEGALLIRRASGQEASHP